MAIAATGSLAPFATSNTTLYVRSVTGLASEAFPVRRPFYLKYRKISPEPAGGCNTAHGPHRAIGGR